MVRPDQEAENGNCDRGQRDALDAKLGEDCPLMTPMPGKIMMYTAGWE